MSMMSKEGSITELLLSLDSSEVEEAELVRAAVNQQLSSDRGGAVLSSLVDYYLDSSSSQALLLLSSIREPQHKPLLEKLNESLSRAGTRLAGLTLLGHLTRKQPPWVHHISRSALLPSLLRCLKTDGDVVVLITGVLVLITLLPMIPQAGKQHIYDFFDVFGRLASWTHKTPGHVPVIHLVHLHAGVYSLFHRLYGMFPCNFISYLRLHYSMKENLDTFQEVVKPMLEHVRVHPELVTGTQDYELDPSRWRCYEVHDIVIECSRVSLDPLESSCEDDVYSSPTSSSPRPPPLSSPLPYLNLTSSPPLTERASSSGSPSLSGQSHLDSSYIQVDDVKWSPSSHCGLSTPPPEPASSDSAPPLARCSSLSGEVKPGPQVEQREESVSSFQPITEREQSDVIIDSEEIKPESQAPPTPSPPPRPPLLFTSTPSTGLPPPLHPPTHRSEEGGSAQSDSSSAPPYEPLFELALPRAATLLIGKKTQEVLERTSGEKEEEREAKEEQISMSPLKVLDQLIIHGHDVHERLSRRFSSGSRSVDRSQCGGKQQSMKTKGPAQGEELQSLRSQLLLVHSQLQYERFKRQQHAVRNRRLLRRVINATALEEHAVAMRAQLGVLDEEIRSLKMSLEEEQRRYHFLQKDATTHTDTLHTHIAQLLLQHQDEQTHNQRLQTELLESQSKVKDLEAELQRANNKAYSVERQLTQLSLKLCSSEQLQQQMFLLNQQLVLLKETNRALTEQLEGGETHSWTEASMLQCSVGKEYQRLKDSDVQHRQKLEAANHRIAELENQLAKRDQLVLDQKKLLEETKNHSRAELSASDSRCIALRRIVQTLQTEMLHLYSQVHLEESVSSRSNGGGVDAHRPRLSSSAVNIINGAVEALSTSPLLLTSSSPLSLSPIESPLAVGSFLEQRSRQLFNPTSQSQEEEEQEEEKEEKEEKEEEEEAQPGSPPLGQEVEEAALIEPPSQASAPPPPAPAAPPDLTLAVRQRRHELSIMDYDETLPEF
ncbi:TSC complex subunit 1a isoform X2 [Mugil cephalus]|uniref:TSC complex subunit 1a isoform X2 n=1 Tax=Mugil cephalus TaxID=48193 RepID=UPI001FB624A7|nr:TSC complex subunit 1a isoform X2 [Mugil cephalus]